MTRYFAALAAVRIQPWLAATPDLKHLRGASEALKVATAVAETEEIAAAEPLEVDQWLTTLGLSGVTIARAPSQIDGVVALEAGSEQEARMALLALARWLPPQLPRVQWAGWWHGGSSYVDAFVAAERDGAHHIQVLPALKDNGLPEACPTCGSEVAGPHRSESGQVGEAQVTDGADCSVRQNADAASRSSRTHEVAPGVRPADFTDLARRGGLQRRNDPAAETGGANATGRAVGRRESRNHLATVVADGNGMGGFFARLASVTGAQTLHATAITLLNDATLEAAQRAAGSIGAGNPGIAASLLHYRGGDDVMASVAAPYGWHYAIKLAQVFAQLRMVLSQALAEDAHAIAEGDRELLRDEIDRVSLGVGLCFAHASHPFAETNRAAHTAMAAAKRFARGASGAIGWVDLTSDDTNRVGVIGIDAALADLVVEHGRPARDIFRMSPSGRSRLADLLRESASPEQAVATWVKRRTDPATREAGVTITSTPHELGALLSRARWWPVVETDEARS